MDNVIYNELRLRGFNVDVGSVIKRQTDPESGKRLAKQPEIDFVANLGSRRFYIQSACSLPDEAKIAQEKNSLLELKDSFKKSSSSKTLSNQDRMMRGSCSSAFLIS